MSTNELTASILALPVSERIRLADELYASVPDEWQAGVDQAWLEEVEKRDREMDENPDACLTFDEFKAAFAHRHRKP
tara:strand:- start:2933 stop:3163 length:231 start_codon:yes stop_codon:yes gene_type:complete